jgi:hypothetical protein
MTAAVQEPASLERLLGSVGEPTTRAVVLLAGWAGDPDSVAQPRGSMSRVHMPDPAGFEGANDVRTLMSWSSRATTSPDQDTTDEPGG